MRLSDAEYFSQVKSMQVHNMAAQDDDFSSFGRPRKRERERESWPSRGPAQIYGLRVQRFVYGRTHYEIECCHLRQSNLPDRHQDAQAADITATHQGDRSRGPFDRLTGCRQASVAARQIESARFYELNSNR